MAAWSSVPSAALCGQPNSASHSTSMPRSFSFATICRMAVCNAGDGRMRYSNIASATWSNGSMSAREGGGKARLGGNEE
jgi:hypothetical protein